jgi:hypothetical protein
MAMVSWPSGQIVFSIRYSEFAEAYVRPWAALWLSHHKFAGVSACRSASLAALALARPHC